MIRRKKRSKETVKGFSEVLSFLTECDFEKLNNFSTKELLELHRKVVVISGKISIKQSVYSFPRLIERKNLLMNLFAFEDRLRELYTEKRMEEVLSQIEEFNFNNIND